MPPSPLAAGALGTRPTPSEYRTLFRRVGAPWLWFSRLVMDDAALTRDHPRSGGRDLRRRSIRPGSRSGMLELDFRERAQCEISYFGLVPELAGTGPWPLADGAGAGARLAQGRRAGVGPHLHARSSRRARLLPRQGFAPIGRTIETFADPRAGRAAAARRRASDPAARRQPAIERDPTRTVAERGHAAAAARRHRADRHRTGLAIAAPVKRIASSQERRRRRSLPRPARSAASPHQHQAVPRVSAKLRPHRVDRADRRSATSTGPASISRPSR